MLTYVISNINKSIAFEWLAIELNKSNKLKLCFILLNRNYTELEHFLISNGFEVFRIKYNGKKSIPFAIIKTTFLLIKQKTKIIHTHLFEANIIGLTAAFLARIPKRIHTRHHSDYHHIYYPNIVKYDRYINYLSTDIVAISIEVRNILINNEYVPDKKVHLIHHGFKLEDFNNNSQREVSLLIQKFNPRIQKPVIGVIARQTEWKGVQFIISAYKIFLEKYPESLLIMANATGDYKNEIHKLLLNIPAKNYIEIEFENDIFSLYRLFDIFTHVPISKSVEAFGQIYVEALASGIPSVFTLSGVANEFIINEQNALVVPYKNSDAIYNSWIRLINDKELCFNLIYKGKMDVKKYFSLKKSVKKHIKLYLE